MSHKTTPIETIEQVVRRTSRKSAISSKISPTINLDNSLICHICDYPNVLATCEYCKKGVCFICTSDKYDNYCMECIATNKELVHIIQAIEKTNSNKCCIFM
jgi:hypothetical protein